MHHLKFKKFNKPFFKICCQFSQKRKKTQTNLYPQRTEMLKLNIQENNEFLSALISHPVTLKLKKQKQNKTKTNKITPPLKKTTQNKKTKQKKKKKTNSLKRS